MGECVSVFVAYVCVCIGRSDLCNMYRVLVIHS